MNGKRLGAGVVPMVCRCCGCAFGVINVEAYAHDVALKQAIYLCPTCRVLPEAELDARLVAIEHAAMAVGS